MDHETPEDLTGDAVPHLKAEEVTVRESQVGRLEAARADVDGSQIGSMASDRAQVSDSKVGFMVARELQSDETEAGIVIAFSQRGTVNAQVDARSVVVAAGVIGLVLFVLGRIFRRN
jgi:preprotein translocase subunit Sec61beta